MSERVESLLEEILNEQRRTNQLLVMLIEAMADAEEALTYLDGTPVGGDG